MNVFLRAPFFGLHKSTEIVLDYSIQIYPQKKSNYVKK